MSISFTQHPRQVGESYLEHFGVAMSFAGPMILGGLACAVHAFLPFLCTSTGSGTVRRLHDRMVVNRTRRAPADTGADSPAGSPMAG